MRLNLSKCHALKTLAFCIFLISSLLSCNKPSESERRKLHFENVSMIRLVAAPERFEGKFVRTTAYLNIDSGRLTAYPSREAYLARDNDSAFYLDLEPRRASELADVFKDRHCMIEGRVTYLNERYYEFIQLGKFTEAMILVDTDSPRNDFQSKDIYIDELEEKAKASRKKQAGHP